MKILILRFSSIGDIVLTTPVIRAVKQQLRGDDGQPARVHFCTKARYAGLLADNPHVDKVHTLEDSLPTLLRELRAENFDYVVDLHHNLRTWLVKRTLGRPAYSFNKLNWEKWLYVRFKINRLPNVHVVDRYLQTVAPLGVRPDGKGLDYFIPYRDEVETEWLPETHRNGYVVYAIGAQFATKQLPVGRMIELCDRINKPIVLLGDQRDAARGEELTRFFERRAEGVAYEPGLTRLNKKTVLYNACGRYNLNQSASLVRGAQVVFTHDTGLMHIAAAFGKTIYSIWGNTTPFFGMYPYKTRFVVLENNKVRCRPCSKIGHARCPQGHFKCMQDLVFDFYLP